MKMINNIHIKMTLGVFLLLSSVLYVSFGVPCNCNDNGNSLWYNDDIVPTVLGSIPPSVAQITFPNGNFVVVTGQPLGYAQVPSQPQSITFQSETNALYTIVMIDLDSPSQANPNQAQYVQWLVVNAQGQSASSNIVGSGDAIAPYNAPTPDLNTGTHRYVFLIFQQNSQLSNIQLSQRQNFNVNNFASQNNLGAAVAGNFFLLVTGNGTEAGSQYWYHDDIVPTVIPTVPQTVAEIQFPSGVVVTTGIALEFAQVASQPTSISYPWNANSLYTIVMFDIDNPSESSPTQSQYVQWLIVNVPGQSASSNNLGTGNVVAPYNGPASKSNTGRHRYVFLVFQQTSQLNNIQLSKRPNFNVLDFARQNQLGEPVAGNFFIIYTNTVSGNSKGSQYWYNADIVPTVLSAVPQTLAEVIFTNGAVVATGKALSFSQVTSPPQSISYPWNANSLYTIVMFDLDNPSEASPTQSQYVQWLVVNVQGQSATSNNLSTGDVIAPYVPPSVNINSGTHRYVILVYQQNAKLNNIQLSARPNFNVVNFASQNGLNAAIAGNFFIIYTDI